MMAPDAYIRFDREVMTQTLLNANSLHIPWQAFAAGHTTGKVHVLTDPAYSTDVHDRMTSCAQENPEVKGVRHRDAGFDPITSADQTLVCTLAGQVTGWTLAYTDLESVGLWKAGLRGKGHIRTVVLEGTALEYEGYLGSLPWFRWSMPQLSGDRPPQGSEAIVLGHGAGRCAYFGPGNLVSLKHLCLRGDGKHRTEKPLDQALDLVAWFTAPGDLVLDPFAGRGTFGLACRLLGRNYIGAELQPIEQQLGAMRIMSGEDWMYPRDGERAQRWFETSKCSGFGPWQFKKGERVMV